MSSASVNRGSVKNRGFTLVELLVVIAIIGVLVALLLPAIQAAREAARKATCKNHLRQIVLGVLNFESSKGKFPTGALIPYSDSSLSYDPVNAGSGLSWHAWILPYIEQQALHDKFYWQVSYQENKDVGANPVEIYWCPSNSEESHTGIFSSASMPSGPKAYTQHYNGVSGPVLLDSNPVKGYDDDESFYGDNEFPPVEYGGPNSGCNSRGGFSRLGVFYPGSHVRVGQITDGTSNTIAIGERTTGETSWIVGLSNSRNWACDATGFKNIKQSINLCLEPGGNDSGGCENFFNARIFASFHPGGCHFAQCDGSVAFFSETMEMSVYQAKSTRGFGELE